MKKALALIPALMLIVVVSGCTGNGNGTNGPADIYTAYKIEFDNCNNFNDYLPVIIKYADQGTVDALNSEEFQNVSDEQRDGMFEFIKSVSRPYGEFDNIEEEIDGDTATLAISTNGGIINATVLMVRENNIWKLKQESWS